MRHGSDLRWPALGHRFDRARGRVGSTDSFTFSAFDLLLARPVTVRAISEHAPPHERDLFEREAEALSRLGMHSAIVALYERLRIAELDVLVLQGASVRLSAGKPVDAARAVRVILTLAGGVETAHQIGLLHGGIEPEAILYDETGAPMLAGFHRRIADPTPPVLHSATSHTAPEVLLGEPVTEAVDVYGLGSTLYELLAGHPAIRSYPDESTAALSLRVITGTTATLARPDVPFELVDILNWTLAVDPASRPPSVAWLAEELGRIERREGWPHTRFRVGSEAGNDLPRPQPAARHRAS